MPISICLLLDSFKVPFWQESIIDFILLHPGLRVSIVIINQSTLRSGCNGRMVYRAIRKLDRTLFKSKVNQFGLIDLQDRFSDANVMWVMPKQTKHKDECLSEDIERIKAYHPDILIRFGFRILKGEILTVAKFGVWSLHHGDSAVNRGGPPAFWEVVNRESITGVTLQILSEKLDAGIVLGKSFCKTDTTSFNRNQNNVYAAGVELFCGKLRELANMGADDFFSNLNKENSKIEYSPTLYRDPKNLEAIFILLKFAAWRIKETVNKFFFDEQWAIYFHRDKESPFSFKSSNKLKPPLKSDWADPFLFLNEGKDYLFFENLNKKSGKGTIDCLILNEDHETPFCVLEEPYHLSYPTITAHNGKLYLLAEAAQSKSVWLYECLEFPKRWKKIEPLLNDVEFFDPTLYCHDGIWYLFGTQRLVKGTSADQYLHIYFSKDLLNGEWKPHPKNPISRDVRGSRSAGNIFNHQGKLIRASQIGAPKYGFGTRLQEIVKLSPQEYEEIKFMDLLPWGNGLLATHTYNFSGDYFFADGQSKRFRFF
jgi:hypothetical protein